MSATLSVDRFLEPIDSVAAEPRRAIGHDPRPEMMLGGAITALIVIGFGGWAATTRLDAAVISPGTVRVAGERRVIQTASGGVVSAVHVANGGTVRAGQVIIEFTTTEAMAQQRSLAARVYGLEAEIARLGAALTGNLRVPAPPRFALLKGEDAALGQQALAMEQAQLDAEYAVETSQRGVLGDRAAQVAHQIDGYQQRLSSARRQGAYNGEELRAYETLYANGLATKPRILALKRSAAAIDGEAGATVAEIARLRSAAGEARLQLLQIRRERASQNAERLRAARNELAAMLPQWQAATEQLRRTVVRAPVAGTVTALHTPNRGAVVAAGAALMEIVPARGAVTIETRVALADANDVKVGDHAEVRLSSLRGRILPAVHGVIQLVSADSMQDQNTGEAFYTATVRVSESDLARVSRLGDVQGGVRSGTPVEVVVATKPRSALAYMVGPLTARMTNSLSER